LHLHRCKFNSQPQYCCISSRQFCCTLLPLSPKSVIWYKQKYWEINCHTTQCSDHVDGLAASDAVCRILMSIYGLIKKPTAPSSLFDVVNSHMMTVPMLYVFRKPHLCILCQLFIVVVRQLCVLHTEVVA